MSAEPRRTTTIEAWTHWENQVVDGRFPLRRYLGGSSHGAVFLTEHKLGNLPQAAIKLVRADPLQAQARLAQWQAAAALSHPNLVRLFEVGRWQPEGHDFVFVVTEYAEQTLAQILARRALSGDEVRELLPATIDALTFLHRRHLVHGQLKPSNFVAVDDRLKLTSETIRPADPSASPASDIWSLGMTLFEALTQRVPTSSEQRFETLSLPASLPASLVDTVRRCLSPTAADRPTIIQLRAEYRPAPQADSIAQPEPPVHEPAREVTPPRSSPQRHPWPWVIAIALVMLITAWIGLRPTETSQAHLQPVVVPNPTLAAAPASAAPSVSAKPVASSSRISRSDARSPEQPALPTASSSPSVLHEVRPEVPSAILEQIQGRIYVSVRVLIDPAGNVVGAMLEESGPSKYFARRAEVAARQWQFTPADTQASRVWLLRFKFTRSDITVRAIEQ